MKTKTLTLALTLAVLSALAVFPTAASAQEPGFTDSFESLDLAGWEHSPDAVVHDQVLQLGPGNFAVRWGDWSAFVLRLRARSSGPAGIGINYCLRDEGHYTLHLTGGEARLERFDAAGEPLELAAATGPAPAPGEWLDLEVSLAGGRHEITAGGTLLIAVDEEAPLRGGGIGLQSEGDGLAEFDDISLVSEAAAEGAGSPGGEGTTGGDQPVAQPGDTEAGGGPEAAGSSSGGLGAFLSSLLEQRDPVQTRDAIINLALAALFSFILSRVYIMWGAALSNRRRFAANFMLVTMTTAFVILVVRSSVALSLGLVGALSIVRFRTAVKDPEELAYLFFAISLGIGLGDNQRLLTIVALAVGIALIGLIRLFRRRKADVNLHLTVAAQAPGQLDLDDILQTLDRHCAKVQLLRLDENEGALEASFAVEFRNIDQLQAARTALKGLSGTLDLTFIDGSGLW